jgi:uncharacterized protein YjbJ (UPF0337 family)
MPEPEENEIEETESHGLRDRVSGFGQKIIGEIEAIGGILTGDPTTQAEGEFNVEVGDLREEIEEDLEKSDRHHGDSGAQSEKE